jgi:hypothetical protein
MKWYVEDTESRGAHVRVSGSSQRAHAAQRATAESALDAGVPELQNTNKRAKSTESALAREIRVLILG